MLFRIFLLTLIGGITLSSARAQIFKSDGNIGITTATAPWFLHFPAADFELKEKRFEADGSQGYVLLVDKTTELNVSFYIETAAEGSNPAHYRDAAWEKSRPRIASNLGEIADIRTADSSGYATLEYTLPEIKGVKIQQKNMNVHFVRDGLWIDVHISKVLFEEKDQALFDSFVRSMSFASKEVPKGGEAPPAKAAGTAEEYFQKGSGAYLKHDYAEAKQWYRKALEMEKQHRTLTDTYWRVLIDNLGMAYGVSGDMESARQTFAYGISQDSTYPMFYYNMACAHAEMGELNPCISNLKRAFALRGNVLPGESMPDPRLDSSFQPYLKNEKFQRALREIELQSPNTSR